MKYIASCSFGKDSLAMIIKIKELGLPLDEVIYCDIRFNEEISGEMPEMAEFIPKAEKILKDRWGVEVKHIKGDTFENQFYRVYQKGKSVGLNYGFPVLKGRWCTNTLKVQPIKKYINSIKEPITQYVGIAYDEPERYERLNHETHIAPLYDLKITEKEAMEICKQYDLLSPIYQTSFRGGCWFCTCQTIKQTRHLYHQYPNLWNKLKEMEKDSRYTFRSDTTIEQLENRFKTEDSQMTIYDFIKEET